MFVQYVAMNITKIHRKIYIICVKLIDFITGVRMFTGILINMLVKNAIRLQDTQPI